MPGSRDPGVHFGRLPSGTTTRSIGKPHSSSASSGPGWAAPDDSMSCRRRAIGVSSTAYKSTEKPTGQIVRPERGQVLLAANSRIVPLALHGSACSTRPQPRSIGVPCDLRTAVAIRDRQTCKGIRHLPGQLELPRRVCVREAVVVTAGRRDRDHSARPRTGDDGGRTRGAHPGWPRTPRPRAAGVRSPA